MKSPGALDVERRGGRSALSGAGTGTARWPAWERI